ncbi:MAG: transglycosylase SLT domain-containing protein [bacterium]|nr:transglycosylase SLT domain-containing protein [bacterium]
MPFVTLKSNFKISTGAKLAILLGIGIFLSVLSAAFAAESPDASIASKGLVQCGGAGQPLCTLCDLYSGTRRMINFLLFFLALPAATVAIIAAGILFLISGGSESLRTQGKDTLKWAVIGLVIAFGGWVIINTALQTLGYKGNWNDYSICRQFEGLIPNITPSPGGGGVGDVNKTINAGEEILGIANDIYEVMNPDDLAEIVALAKKGQNLASEDLKQVLTLLEKNNLVSEEDIASGSKSPEDFVQALEKYPHLNPETRESVKELLAATSPELREYVFVETLSNPSLLDRVVKESASEAKVYVDGFLIDEKNSYFKAELADAAGKGRAFHQDNAVLKPNFPANYNKQIDEKYGAIIKAASEKYGISEEKIKAIIMTESSGNPGAVSKDNDGKSSYGLMQIRPETAGVSIEQLQTPVFNIDFGTKYYSELMKKYNDPVLASAAYNGGFLANAPSRDCPGDRRWQCEWDDKAHKTANTGYAGTRKYVQKIDELEKALRTGQ